MEAQCRRTKCGLYDGRRYERTCRGKKKLISGVMNGRSAEPQSGRENLYALRGGRFRGPRPGIESRLGWNIRGDTRTHVDPPLNCGSELGGSSGFRSRLFRILSKVPPPSGYFFVGKTCQIRPFYGQINISSKFSSCSTIFAFILLPSTHNNPLSHNVRKSHRYRFGHHLLVSHVSQISRTRVS